MINFELKNLINTAFDAEKMIVDGIQKNYFALISDALQLVSDIPGDVSGFAGLQAEIIALSNPANEADLVQFIQQKMSGISPISGDKAKKIAGIVVSIIAKGIELEQVIVS